MLWVKDTVQGSVITGEGHCIGCGCYLGTPLGDGRSSSDQQLSHLEIATGQGIMEWCDPLTQRTARIIDVGAPIYQHLHNLCIEDKRSVNEDWGGGERTEMTEVT